MTLKPYIELAESLRKDLHAIPEGSMREVKTKERLIAFLREHTGLELIDRGVWFYAAYRNKAALNTLAFRADLDAVTGEDGICRHLCGHDGHAAILAAFAVQVWKIQPESNVIFIFQPGEESGEGGALCASIAELEQIDCIYGFHNIPGYETGQILVRNGTFACASTGLKIRLIGKSAHAAYPETGVNPAEACAGILSQILALSRRPARGIVLATPVGIELGSAAYGLSAGAGTLRFTLRAEFSDEFDTLLQETGAIVKRTCERFGLSYSIEAVEPFPATENDTACVRRLIKAASQAGLCVCDLPAPLRWSEDFGHFLRKIPGAYFGIGAGLDCSELHTPSYAFNDAIIPSALLLYGMLCGCVPRGGTEDIHD